METEDIRIRTYELLRSTGRQIPAAPNAAFESNLASRETIMGIYSTRLFIALKYATHKQSTIATFQDLVDCLAQDRSSHVRVTNIQEHELWCFTDAAVTQLYAVFDTRDTLPSTEKT